MQCSSLVGYELPSAGFVKYLFPLREDRIVSLFLPADLRESEVQRLVRFMSSLVVDEV